MDESDADRLTWIEEATRPYFRIYWPLTASFTTCAPSPGHSGGNRVDPWLLDNVVKFRTCGVSTFFHVGSSVDLHSIINQDWLQQESMRKRENKQQFFTAVSPMTDSQDDEPYDVMTTRKVLHKTNWKNIPGRSMLDQSQKRSGKRIRIPANTVQCHFPSQLCTSWLFWKSGEHPNWRDSVSESFSFSPHPPPKKYSEGYLGRSTRRWNLKMTSESKVFHILQSRWSRSDTIHQNASASIQESSKQRCIIHRSAE